MLINLSAKCLWYTALDCTSRPRSLEPRLSSSWMISPPSRSSPSGEPCSCCWTCSGPEDTLSASALTGETVFVLRIIRVTKCACKACVCYPSYLGVGIIFIYMSRIQGNSFKLANREKWESIRLASEWLVAYGKRRWKYIQELLEEIQENFDRSQIN